MSQLFFLLGVYVCEWDQLKRTAVECKIEYDIEELLRLIDIYSEDKLAYTWNPLSKSLIKERGEIDKMLNA